VIEEILQKAKEESADKIKVSYETAFKFQHHEKYEPIFSMGKINGSEIFGKIGDIILLASWDLPLDVYYLVIDDEEKEYKVN
jgi:hypothetical protein